MCGVACNHALCFFLLFPFPFAIGFPRSVRLFRAGGTPALYFAMKRTSELDQRSSSTASLPLLEDGSTYHLGLSRGDVAPRILSVGARSRAKLLVRLLEPGSVRRVESSRGFAVWTGLFGITRVSILHTMMGYPNMDFVVREVRLIQEPPILIIRLGTCGTPRPDLSAGTVVCATTSRFITIDPDVWIVPRKATKDPYRISAPFPADEALIARYYTELQSAAEEGDVAFDVVLGEDITAPCFYCSQGRPSEHFDDRNEHVLDKIGRKAPDAASLQMETFHLYALPSSFTQPHIWDFPAPVPLNAAAAHCPTPFSPLAP